MIKYHNRRKSVLSSKITKYLKEWITLITDIYDRNEEEYIKEKEKDFQEEWKHKQETRKE